MIKVLMILGLVSIGCVESPRSVDRTDNANFSVGHLFTHDGCKVFRFLDGSRHVYYVTCKSADAQTKWSESCGKNCTRDVNVPTVEVSK